MDQQKYQQAKTGGAYSIIEEAGYLLITGADRTSFLQRQSTNDMNLLQPDRFTQTVLTSPTARILDVLIVFEEEDGETLAVLPLPGRTNRTERYLRSRIFFQDKVTVTQTQSLTVHFNISGKNAAQQLHTAGLSTVNIPQPGEVKRLQIADLPALILGANLLQPGFRIMLSASSRDSIIYWLEKNGFCPLTSQEQELFRITAGIPGEKNELTEEYTPLETGFQGAVSSNKGCYTGQEIIARQITYDKITRRQTGLRMEASVHTGDKILVEDKPAGVITSVALSPDFGNIALAMIKRPFFEAENTVSVLTDQGKILGRVCDLPFG